MQWNSIYNLTYGQLLKSSAWSKLFTSCHWNICRYKKFYNSWLRFPLYMFWVVLLLLLIIRPSSDGTYYGMVMSVRPSVRPSQFSALFSYMLWDIELKFCLSLYYDARKSKFECHQFPSIFDGVMPLFNFKLLQICSFPHFSPSYCDISSWNLAYDFVLLYYRTSSSVDDFRQFLLELCPFWNFEYWKYTVFRTFLLHALTYLAEILRLTLFYRTTDQVSVLSISVNFCRSYAPFGT